MNAMHSVHDIADYFIRDAGRRGQQIRHMKLQRLCYYAQGFYAALYDGSPLFRERLEAWQYGPVVPDLHERLDPYGSHPVPPGAARRSPSPLPREVLDYLDLVIARLSSYGDWDLAHATCQEGPWRDARSRAVDGGDNEIPVHALLEWFVPRAHQISLKEAPAPPSRERIQEVRELAQRLLR